MLSLLASSILVASATANPFLGQNFYVNPAYQAELDSSIATATGLAKTNLQQMRNIPSAYWIDVKSKIHGNTTDTLEGILKDAASKKELAVVILYDLPNRDCKAKASNGEICCTANADGTCNYDAGGDCSAGIQDYQQNYVNPFVEVVAQYDSQTQIVVIIEPDSLPNLASNLADPHCGNTATQAAYKTGVPYAVNTLRGKAPNTAIYLDAAHGGWLGWDDNAVAFAKVVASLGITQSLTGLATNVANYQPIGIMCPWAPSSATRNDYCLPDQQHSSDPCCADPCHLESQWNPGNNEMNYVQSMSKTMQAIANWSPQFVVDTGRAGVADMRQDCSNWCNIRGAGVGHFPTTDTGSSLIDAFYWLKTPGESDGCTQMTPDGTACARFDAFCGSEDSIGSRAGEPRAPEAGKWFDYQVKMLATNAKFN